MPSKAFTSPTRTYIALTDQSIAKKFELPENLPNYSSNAFAWFNKYLDAGEHILVCLPFENLQWIKVIDELPMWDSVVGMEAQMDAFQEMASQVEDALDQEPLFGLIGDPPVLSTMEPPESGE